MLVQEEVLGRGNRERGEAGVIEKHGAEDGALGFEIRGQAPVVVDATLPVVVSATLLVVVNATLPVESFGWK
jgi:hypothetical protein